MFFLQKVLAGLLVKPQRTGSNVARHIVQGKHALKNISQESGTLCTQVKAIGVEFCVVKQRKHVQH